MSSGSIPARIGAGDPRYLVVVAKRFNKRFTTTPDYVRLVGDEQIMPLCAGNASP